MSTSPTPRNEYLNIDAAIAALPAIKAPTPKVKGLDCPCRWLALGAFFAGLSVALGALATHALTDYFATKYAGQTREVAGVAVPLAQKYLADFKTGAEYQMYHGLALLAVGMLIRGRRSLPLKLAGLCFVLGIILFSGSLYALTLTDERQLGIVVPIGGVLFLCGWLAMGIAAAAPDLRTPVKS